MGQLGTTPGEGQPGTLPLGDEGEGEGEELAALISGPQGGAVLDALKQDGTGLTLAENGGAMDLGDENVDARLGQAAAVVGNRMKALRASVEGPTGAALAAERPVNGMLAKPGVGGTLPPPGRKVQ